MVNACEETAADSYLIELCGLLLSIALKSGGSSALVSKDLMS